MRNLILSLPLLLSLAIPALLAIPGNAADPEPASTVSAMSFNIRFGTAQDGDNAWPHRRDLVAETIRRRDPDVLGLQEALPFQVEFLSEKLPQYEVYAVGREQGSGETCAILYRKDRFTKLEEGTFWLSETPDEPGSKSWDSMFARILSWVRLKPAGSEKAFLFANTHFDHKGKKARSESAKLIRRKLPELAKEAPVIVTGDFNCGESSGPWRTLAEGDVAWLDTYRQHVPEPDPEAEAEATFTGFGLRRGKARIDWVLCSPGWKILDAGIDRHRGPDGRHPSDHEPVFAELALEE